MALQFYQLSLPGDRESNQDSTAHIIDDSYALFAVADGLGGHHAGEKASRVFCRGMLDFAETYSKLMAQDPVGAFLRWIDAAINEMRAEFSDDLWASEAHTTCALLYLDKRLALTAHCGDSRIYRLNPNRILWRTKDHSLPQQLLDENRITEEQMAQHPEQNRLTRSINIMKMQKPEINLYSPIRRGETFIVCSDGFWGYVKQQELLQMAQLNSGEPELEKLARMCILRARGNSDNVTVQWVRCR